MLYPPSTQRFVNEIIRFQQTEEGKAFATPFKEYIDYLSKSIDEPVDFLKMSYLDLGLEMLVRKVTECYLQFYVIIFVIYSSQF